MALRNSNSMQHDTEGISFIKAIWAGEIPHLKKKLIRRHIFTYHSTSSREGIRYMGDM
jgi:hypothetical protein